MKTNWSNHRYPNLSTLFIIYYWKKKIILYIIEKCNSMLSCTYPNDLQYNIVVMKASIKPWRQGLEPRLKGHQYASLSRREGEIKEMVEPIHWIIDRILWGTQISLFEKSRHNHLATQLYTSFSQLSPLKNLMVGYCIRLTPGSVPLDYQTPLSSLFPCKPSSFFLFG